MANKRIGVLGTPGSGKTTLAKFLYMDEIPKSADVSPTRSNYTLYTDEEYDKGLCKGLIELNDKFGVTNIFDSKSHQFSKDYSAEIEILKECDVIIYVIVSEKIFDYRNQDNIEIKRYLKQIKKELKIYSEYFEKTVKKGDNKAFIIIPNEMADDDFYDNNFDFNEWFDFIADFKHYFFDSFCSKINRYFPLPMSIRDDNTDTEEEQKENRKDIKDFFNKPLDDVYNKNRRK